MSEEINKKESLLYRFILHSLDQYQNGLDCKSLTYRFRESFKHYQITENNTLSALSYLEQTNRINKLHDKWFRNKKNDALACLTESDIIFALIVKKFTPYSFSPSLEEYLDTTIQAYASGVASYYNYDFSNYFHECMSGINTLPNIKKLKAHEFKNIQQPLAFRHSFKKSILKFFQSQSMNALKNLIKILLSKETIDRIVDKAWVKNTLAKHLSDLICGVCAYSHVVNGGSTIISSLILERLIELAPLSSQNNIWLVNNIQESNLKNPAKQFCNTLTLKLKYFIRKASNEQKELNRNGHKVNNQDVDFTTFDLTIFIYHVLSLSENKKLQESYSLDSTPAAINYSQAFNCWAKTNCDDDEHNHYEDDYYLNNVRSDINQILIFLIKHTDNTKQYRFNKENSSQSDEGHAKNEKREGFEWLDDKIYEKLFKQISFDDGDNIELYSFDFTLNAIISLTSIPYKNDKLLLRRRNSRLAVFFQIYTKTFEFYQSILLNWPEHNATTEKGSHSSIGNNPTAIMSFDTDETDSPFLESSASIKNHPDITKSRIEARSNRMFFIENLIKSIGRCDKNAFVEYLILHTSSDRKTIVSDLMQLEAIYTLNVGIDDDANLIFNRTTNRGAGLSTAEKKQRLFRALINEILRNFTPLESFGKYQLAFEQLHIDLSDFTVEEKIWLDNQKNQLKQLPQVAKRWNLDFCLELTQNIEYPEFISTPNTRNCKITKYNVILYDYYGITDKEYFNENIITQPIINAHFKGGGGFSFDIDEQYEDFTNNSNMSYFIPPSKKSYLGDVLLEHTLEALAKEYPFEGNSAFLQQQMTSLIYPQKLKFKYSMFSALAHTKFCTPYRG
ncbi:hypothetical protein LMJ53_14275 [Rheinheimera sp. UJ51]|uniref:hypothetical protein n=1 Tax=Rheinheimera sp. UJ51 TaxID=2892446 RepID=UPI001E2EEC17|nr:hypothetical protein [Rheinheimera sp. UJ51]MCC5452890.1 hypothetical protein [Rheinheimera sp. UJ51]